MKRALGIAVAAIAFSPVAARAEDKPTADADAEKIGKQIESSVARRDPTVIDGLYDVELVAGRGWVGLDLSEKFRKGMIEGMKESATVGAATIKGVGRDGRLELLRVRHDGGDTRVLFRVTRGDGGFGYQEFILVDRDGKTRVADLYSYSAGELASETVRRLTIQMVAPQQPDLLKGLTRAERDARASIELLNSANGHRAKGEWKEALDAYAKLPESVRSIKAILLARCVCARSLAPGGPEHRELLAEVERRFKDDGAMAMLLFEAYAVQKRWDDVFGALDRLDAAIGRDPYLDYQRALFHQAEGKVDLARKLDASAIARDPTLLPPRWHLIGLALADKSWTEVVQRLDEIEARGVALADLTKIRAYSEFVKTKEYSDWMAARAAKKK